MHDDTANPLDAKIESIEELLKDTENQVTSTLKELQEAEESGNIEEYLEKRKQQPEK